ncbi:class I SAM-dependent methyltransferase [Leucobacter sp. BZR 635]
MRHPQLSPAGLTIWDLPEGCLAVDVLFSGRRIWTVESAELELGSENLIPWPEPLAPHLLGRTAATVADSATGAALWQGEIQFSADGTQTTVERADGLALSVNKWGLLAPDLANLSDAVIASLLDETGALIDLLLAQSKRPFIVGGTLLGAVRSGKLLPHDDDVDIAFLSEHTNPALVGAETLSLARALRAAGYEVVEHSAAHLQLVFRDECAAPSFHIDVFAAFFTDDGNINQPFHVRGPFAREQMLPFSTATLHGVDFPAPADVESWLVLNYDENWRTPIPGFKLETPEATVRRFENWFGGFNFKREFWDDWFMEPANAAAAPWKTGQSWIERQPLTSPLVIDLGCGAGGLSRSLAERHPERAVHGVDFSAEALSHAREAAAAQTNLSFGEENLSRLSVLLAPQRAGHTGPFDVVANHILEQISHRARANMLRLIRLSLRSGGNAYATAYASYASDVSPDDPATWHLDQSALAAEAVALGLLVTFTDILPARGEASRGPYGVSFSLPAEPLSPAALAQKAGINMSLASRLKARFSRAARPQAAKLQAEILELREEVDELRHDNLRVAEVLDLLEDQLLTGAAHSQGHLRTPLSE